MVTELPKSGNREESYIATDDTESQWCRVLCGQIEMLMLAHLRSWNFKVQETTFREWRHARAPRCTP